MTVLSTPAQESALDLGELRRTLGQFATGVTVVTAAADGTLAGVTSNSFASVSLEPPLLLWSLKLSSKSIDAFRTCTAFAVNVLADHQLHLAANFARSVPNKFEGIAWRPGTTASPLLDGAIAVMECAKERMIEAGDHVILIGRVIGFSRHDGVPLLFSQGSYAVPAEHPSAVDRRAQAQEDVPEIGSELVSVLLARAFAGVSRLLADARRLEHLDINEGRLLQAVYSTPNRTLEQLMPELLFGSNESLSVVRNMVDRDFIMVDAEGRIAMTPTGHRRYGEVSATARKAEDDALGPIAPQELNRARDMLKHIVEALAAHGR